MCDYVKALKQESLNYETEKIKKYITSLYKINDQDWAKATGAYTFSEFLDSVE